MAYEEQIAAAKAAGYNDAQIQEYMASRKLITEPAVATEPIVEAEPIAEEAAPEVSTVDPVVQDEGPVAKARAMGYTDVQIAQYMKQRNLLAQPDEGFKSVSDVPAEDGSEQYSELPAERVAELSAELGVDPSTRQGMNAIYKRDQQAKGIKWTAKSARDFFSNAEEVYDVARPYAWFKSMFGGRAEIEYNQFKQQNVKDIVDEAKERGLHLEHDGSRFFVRDTAGNPVAVEPGILESLGKSKYEAIGGIGAGVGAVLAANRAFGAISQMGPWGKLGTAALIGGAAIVGGVAGEQVDYLDARIAMQEEFDAKLALEKAIGTVQFGIIGEVLGGATIKLGAKTASAVSGAFSSLVAGNRSAAYETLKQSLGGITDDQVREIISSWEKVNQISAPGKDLRAQAMAVLPTTMPGGDALVAQAARRNFSVASSVSNEVAARGRVIIEEADKITNADASSRILASLSDYTNLVKDSFGIVKQMGADLAPPNYKFDLPQLSIKPILEEKIATITDQATRDSFIRTLTSIDNATTSRTFDDLLDLRRTLSGLKYKKRNISPADLDAINASLGTVDDEINAVMKQAGAEDWLEDWKSVNKTYSEYKRIQDNLLFKAVTKKGVSPDAVANAFVKFGTSIDEQFYSGVNTYKQVIDKLPVKVQADVEGLIVQKLVDKRSIGADGFNGIDFPKLSDDLAKFKFNTPQPERLKQAAFALAEVYKNDPKLVQLGRMGSVDYGNNIATTLEGKIKMSLLSHTWERIISYMPTKSGGEVTLVRGIAKLLENPLNAQTTKQVLKQVDDDQSALATTIRELQVQIAKQTAEGAEYQSGRVKLYKNAAGQKFTKARAGAQPISESIASHRIIPAATIRERFNKDPKRLAPAERIMLAKEGFLMILDETGQVTNLN